MSDHDYLSLAEELGVRGRVSGEELRAGCPIHGGRDLNFSLNTRTGLYQCYSQCGGGTFYQLVRAVLGCTASAAREWVLERDYGEPALTAPPQPVSQAWRLEYDLATDGELPQWWFDRGFDWDDAKKWGVRWHPGNQRLLLPVIWDGDLVGTIARNLRAGPKYQNSPGLPRRELLFGAPNLAKPIVLVEGVTDALWLAKHGYNAAALLGLTMSDAQARLLRPCPEVTLALDNDDAGWQGYLEIKRKRFGSLSHLKQVVWPGKDAQDCSAEELAAVMAARHVAV